MLGTGTRIAWSHGAIHLSSTMDDLQSVLSSQQIRACRLAPGCFHWWSRRAHEGEPAV